MAFYTNMVGRTCTSSVDLLLASTAMGTVVSLAVALAGHDPWQLSWSWAAAVYIGAGPMAGGFYLWGRAMAGPAARRLAPLACGTPLLSTLQLIAAGETFTAGTLLGAVLVLICSVGVLAADRLLQEPASA